MRPYNPLVSDERTYLNEQYLDNQDYIVLPSSNQIARRVTLFDSSGNEIISGQSGTATLSSVAGNASSVTLLGANTSRKGMVIHNDSSAILYVAFAATATTSAFTYRLNPFDTLEPKVNYTGLITGIWVSATGNARITELT